MTDPLISSRPQLQHIDSGYGSQFVPNLYSNDQQGWDTSFSEPFCLETQYNLTGKDNEPNNQLGSDNAHSASVNNNQEFDIHDPCGPSRSSMYISFEL